MKTMKGFRTRICRVWKLICPNNRATHRRKIFAPALGVLLIGLLALPAKAQFTSGTILGAVTDPSAAAIPGATVTATNLDTGFIRNVETNRTGDYLMVNMPIGRYQVKVEAPGFKTAVS